MRTPVPQKYASIEYKAGKMMHGERRGVSGKNATNPGIKIVRFSPVI